MPLRLKALDHVGIAVGDLDRSIRFYSEGLGLELLRRRERPGGASSAVLRIGAQEINLLCHPEAAAGTPGPQLIDHVCFEVECAAVGDVLDGLEQAGIPVVRGPVERRDGAAVFVRDPDGVAVELQVKT